VVVRLRRRDAPTRMDSLTLRFGPDATMMETPGLAAGIYDVVVRGGTALVVVNPSRELLPRPPRVPRGTVTGAVTADLAPRLRSAGWAYALAVLLLCAEWILRRRRGMR